MFADRAVSPLKKTRPDSCDSAAAGRPVAMLLVLLASLPAVGAVVGCSDGRPGRLEVSGQVLIDGQPLTYGFVRFVPKGARPSSGELDENGHFTLTCYGAEDGVVPGLHQVEVNAGESLSATKTLWHAPKKYSRYRNSPLTQEITESTDSLVIDLTWDGGKPFTERRQ
jgi:hypothetical protein